MMMIRADEVIAGSTIHYKGEDHFVRSLQYGENVVKIVTNRAEITCARSYSLQETTR